MKLTAILLAAAMCPAGVQALELESLNAAGLAEIVGTAGISVPTPPAAEAPEAPKGGALVPAKAIQQEVVLEIVSREKLTLRAAATYLAGNEGAGCTHLSFSDGQLQALPKVLDMELPVIANPYGGTVSLATKLPGRCDYTMAGFSMRVMHPRIAENLNIVGLRFSPSAQPGVQTLLFRKIVSPWTGESWVITDAAVLVGPDGKAKAEIVLE